MDALKGNITTKLSGPPKAMPPETETMNETTTAENTAAVGGSRLERLVMRFEKMAEIRENQAALKRLVRGDDGESAMVLESAASAYRRCADEVRRVANGEEPAEPGYRWD